MGFTHGGGLIKPDVTGWGRMQFLRGCVHCCRYLPVVGGDIVATRDRRPQASCTSAPYCVDSRSIHAFLRVGAPLDPGRSLHSPVTTAPGRGSRVPPSLQDPNPDQSFRFYCPGVPLDGSAVSISHRHPRCQDFSSGGCNTCSKRGLFSG